MLVPSIPRMAEGPSEAIAERKPSFSKLRLKGIGGSSKSTSSCEDPFPAESSSSSSFSFDTSEDRRGAPLESTRRGGLSLKRLLTPRGTSGSQSARGYQSARGVQSARDGSQSARVPGQPNFLEVDFFKPSGAVIGLTLAAPGDPNLEGVMVAEVEPGGVLAKCKKVAPGDTIHAVNGNVCTTHQEASTLVREAKGIIQFIITRNPLPEGWMSFMEEDGRPWYRNEDTGEATYSHPASAVRRPHGTTQFGFDDSDDDDAPLTDRTSRGHAVSDVITSMQTKKKMVQSVQLETDLRTPRRQMPAAAAVATLRPLKEGEPLRFQSVSL